MSQPQTQPQTKSARGTVTETDKTVDFVRASKTLDDAALERTKKNPLFNSIFDESKSSEQRIDEVVANMAAGLEDGTAKDDDFDRHRQQFNEIVAAIQVFRKQLASDQTREMTAKQATDFQRLFLETNNDVGAIQAVLDPLCGFASLFSKFGSEGNLLDKINQALLQKKQREDALVRWQQGHDAEITTRSQAVRDLVNQIATAKQQLEQSWAWFGKSALQAQIVNLEADLVQRQAELAEANAKQPDVVVVEDSDVPIIGEEILGLQNIGGPQFTAAMNELQNQTETTLAKMSINFDEAVTGLNNMRAKFLTMERNCGDATFALSILSAAIECAEEIARAVATRPVPVVEGAPTTGARADLARMEYEQRTEQVLAYTSTLSTFKKDIEIGITSLRSGRVIIKDILQMNSTALESANTQKLTGMANAGDAVMITIGSILEVANRAAVRVLSDGINSIREMAEKGSAQVNSGVYEGLQQQNAQIANFITSVTHLRETTKTIGDNTVGMIAKQKQLVDKMKEETGKLADVMTEVDQAAFNARAGIGAEPVATEEPPTEQRHSFGLRNRG
jgi:hypothetical protein